MNTRWFQQRFLMLGAGLVVAGMGIVWAQTPMQDPATSATSAENSRSQLPDVPRRSGAYYEGIGSELQAGKWSGGGGLGILGSTPDGSAFAMNGHLDYFVSDRVSVGPLLQLGFTDDLTQVGLSGQGKYWIDVPGTAGRGKVNLQSGVGFTHADFRNSDSSWLVPLGIGYDYTPVAGPTLTGTFLLNFTNLNTGGGADADVMPGFVFGARF